MDLLQAPASELLKILLTWTLQKTVLHWRQEWIHLHFPTLGLSTRWSLWLQKGKKLGLSELESYTVLAVQRFVHDGFPKPKKKKKLSCLHFDNKLFSPIFGLSSISFCSLFSFHFLHGRTREDFSPWASTWQLTVSIVIIPDFTGMRRRSLQIQLSLFPSTHSRLIS